MIASPTHIYDASGQLVYVDWSRASAEIPAPLPFYREEFFVSATQVSTAELCLRKWAFRYIDKIKAPPNKFAVLGVDTHGHTEQWLKHGVVPHGDKPAELAQALIPLLPPPQYVDPAHVEMNQLYSFTAHDVHFMLVVDLFVPNGLGGVPRVYDHKTGSNPDYWLTPETLPGDIQGSLYAAWAMHKTGSPIVDLQWNYVKTKGAMTTRHVVARVDGHMISERLEKSVNTGKRLRMIAQSGARAMDVAYDVAGCSAYGGCPYQDRCNLSPADRVRSMMSDPNQYNGQQPMFAPQVQQPQQQPQYAQQPQFQQQPMFGPINPPAIAPPPPQQVMSAQQPMFAPPPQAVQAPVIEKVKGPGRPSKITKDDPWVAFAVAALPVVLQQGGNIDNVCQIADALEAEMLKRKAT